MDKYYVNPDVTVGMMKRNNFIEYIDRWEYTKELIKRFVILRIIIYKEDLSLIDNVTKAGTNESFISFYNEWFYKNNLIAKKARKRYNAVYKNLEKSGIVIHKSH